MNGLGRDFWIAFYICLSIWKKTHGKLLDRVSKNFFQINLEKIYILQFLNELSKMQRHIKEENDRLHCVHVIGVFVGGG
jgi:hypothetical protein